MVSSRSQNFGIISANNLTAPNDGRVVYDSEATSTTVSGSAERQSLYEINNEVLRDGVVNENEEREIERDENELISENTGIVGFDNSTTSNNNIHQDSGHYSTSLDHIDDLSTTESGIKIGRTDDEVSYEAFGSVEADYDHSVDSRNGSSNSTPSPSTNSSFRKDPRSPNSTAGRQSWLRTSLRRTPSSSGKKTLSSNALASELYRSGSFNSLGRGQNIDNTEDMYSDVSLEDDVWKFDLSQKVHMIEKQMHALADTQSVGEERYARVKQENATLQARILILEEAVRDAEAKAEEKIQAEQRRHKEWASRLEREKQLQLENYGIKLQAVELEKNTLKDEVVRLKDQLERNKVEKMQFENSLEETIGELKTARESERLANNRANNNQRLLEVAKMELVLRANDQQRIEELQQRITELEINNKSLTESRDELQAAVALQTGRELLMLNTCSNNNAEKGSSTLASELLAGINQEQVDGTMDFDFEQYTSLTELKQALKEQQEVNAQLKSYMDSILLNIVNNHPQLLEVKQQH